MKGIPLHLVLLTATVFSVSACARESASAEAEAVPATQAPAKPVASVSTPAEAPSPASTLARMQPNAVLPLAVVHKTPTCGCCGAWVDHLRDAGFAVEVREAEDLTPVKARLGVPYGKGSCHTAEIGGYLVEGHVPADDIKRLLRERPQARGLVLPGMPMGSPGMEMPDGSVQPYTVELVTPDGDTVAYASHGA